MLTEKWKISNRELAVLAYSYRKLALPANLWIM
jgi:hypothetical protein